MPALPVRDSAPLGKPSDGFVAEVSVAVRRRDRRRTAGASSDPIVADGVTGKASPPPERRRSTIAFVLLVVSAPAASDGRSPTTKTSAIEKSEDFMVSFVSFCSGFVGSCCVAWFVLLGVVVVVVVAAVVVVGWFCFPRTASVRNCRQWLVGCNL